MILITGARGVVGAPLRQALNKSQRGFVAVTRQADQSADEFLSWDLQSALTAEQIQALAGCRALIHCAPIWLLPDHVDDLLRAGIRRMAVFSSTSVISKSGSQDPADQILVESLRDAETALQDYAQEGKIDLTILRPSMIYGYGRDENISHIARRLRRLRFMPLAGAGRGLRQPVHADDLVAAALNALESDVSVNQVYTLAGGEQISYRVMVERVFVALGMKPRILQLPVWVVRTLLKLASIGRGFAYTGSMADRMNQDLIYDCSDAVNDLEFSPQAFLQHPERDLPNA